MDETTRQRLFGWSAAFDHPATVIIVVGAAAAIVLSIVLVELLGRRGLLDAQARGHLRQRCLTWAILAPLLIGPVLLGAAWTIGMICLLALACYREMARATGQFRHRSISLLVVLGIITMHLAALDHWYGFFVALPSLTFICLAAIAVIGDRPAGYIQRVALGSLAFLMFGVCFAHLAYIANDRDFRPLILTIFVAIECNDVFAYMVGSTLGRRKLMPNTSPGKTRAGAIGAIVLTMALFWALGSVTFRGTLFVHPLHLLTMGLIISVAGQVGDLVMSSIKRDLAIKDTGTLLPGHGGLLDRFDSLILVAPAIFHYIGYFRGIGLDQPVRIFTSAGAS